MRRTIVVFGATSYVGGELVPILLADGFNVVGVTRRPSAARILLPEESSRFSVRTFRELDSLPAGREIDIVNLARVADLLPDKVYRDNRRLIRLVEEAARGRCRRLIHTSTVAVFGGKLTTAAPGKVRWRPIGGYEESKVLAEHSMERIARDVGCELAIVRLGNVIGPGSPLWVADLAQRIIERKPLIFEGSRGYSNATHVANAADYISHLLGRDDLGDANFGPYHHLAEFSSRRWPELLAAMANAVGHDLITAPPAANWAGNGRGRVLLRRLYRRMLGGHMRAAFGLLPDNPVVERLLSRARSSLTPASPEPVESSSDDSALFELLSAEEQFRTFTVPGWRPPVSFEEACGGIVEWLRASGYSLTEESELIQPRSKRLRK